MCYGYSLEPHRWVGLWDVIAVCFVSAVAYLPLLWILHVNHSGITWISEKLLKGHIMTHKLRISNLPDSCQWKHPLLTKNPHDVD